MQNTDSTILFFGRYNSLRVHFFGAVLILSLLLAVLHIFHSIPLHAMIISVLVFGLILTQILMITHLAKPPRQFGVANSLTLFRAILICLLASFIPGFYISEWLLILLAIFTLILDGVDGWVARRLKQESRFGALFDQEIDATFILILCLMIAYTDKTGWWILISGLLRYIFAGAGYFLEWMQKDLPKSKRRQYICVLQIISLILILLPFNPLILNHLIALIAVCTLLYSFGKDVIWLWQNR